MHSSPQSQMVQPRLAAIRRRLAAGHWVYTVALVLVAASLYIAGDRTWWGTVLLFSPRWIFGLPLLLLVPLALRYRRKWLWWDAALVALLLGLVMGFEIPFPSANSAESSSPTLRVVTCNLQSKRSNLWPLLETAAAADVLMLQECPSDAFEDLPAELRRGWHVAQDGTLCIASRHPLSEPRRLDRSAFGGWGTIAFGCRVGSPLGPFDCVTLHLETPRDGLEAVLYFGQSGIPKLEALTAWRERESRFIRKWIDLEFGPGIVAGDFNMPIESSIYQRFWSDETNAFSAAGFGFGYTKFTHWHGVRIDHILLHGNCKVQRCEVLPDVGSDHRPVMAVLSGRLR